MVIQEIKMPILSWSKTEAACCHSITVFLMTVILKDAKTKATTGTGLKYVEARLQECVP